MNVVGACGSAAVMSRARTEHRLCPALRPKGFKTQCVAGTLVPCDIVLYSMCRVVMKCVDGHRVFLGVKVVIMCDVR